MRKPIVEEKKIAQMAGIVGTDRLLSYRNNSKMIPVLKISD